MRWRFLKRCWLGRVIDLPVWRWSKLDRIFVAVLFRLHSLHYYVLNEPIVLFTVRYLRLELCLNVIIVLCLIILGRVVAKQQIIR